jgi:hypothetical protein
LLVFILFYFTLFLTLCHVSWECAGEGWIGKGVADGGQSPIKTIVLAFAFCL